MRTSTSVLAMTVAALAVITSPATAQETTTPESANDVATNPEAVGAIIITAQKRDQSIQEVPISIQALTSERLQEQHIRDLNEVVTFVPSASEELSNNIGARKYQIRGIAAGLGGDSTIGYYFGDSAFTFIGQSFAPSGRAFDMNRIEVLRGPQSTLYGNGAMGGVIRFIPNDPNLTRSEVHAKAGYSLGDGADDGYYGDLAVSVPVLDDKVGVRLVGSYERVGGYQDLPAQGVKNYDGGHILDLRATLLIRPSDDFDLRFQYSRNEAKQSGSTLVPQLDPPVGAGRVGDFNNNLYSIYSLTARGDLGFATLTSTSTYINFDRPLETSLPFAFSPNGSLTITQVGSANGINNETRLVSNPGSPFQWLVGTFYSGSDALATTSYDPVIIPTSTAKATSDAISFFGEASYELLDGRLIPLVGLRYFRDKRRSRTIGVSSLDGTFDSFNPRFNLSYQPTETSNYYLNVAKGFRSGIFNNPVVCNVQSTLGFPCQNAVPSDYLWSYEVGTKQTLFDRSLLAAASLYYVDWQDITQGVPVIGIFQNYQVGDARLYGVDVQLSYNPRQVRGLSFEIAGNYNNSKFRNLRPILAAVVGANNGDRLPFTPEWTLAASANFERPLGSSDWMGSASVSYNHLAAQVGQFGSKADGDPRDLLRARIGAHSDQLGLFVFGTNLLKESGAIYAQQPTGGASVFTRDYPRVFGLEATLDF